MTKKLLVADDSITIQRVVNLTFADEDVAIEAVTSGDLAIEKARSMKPDIILADVFMPGRNGYEVCSSIKADPELSHIPVVLMVGTFEPFDAAEAERVKCDGYLTKPFDTTELIQTVRSLVGKNEAKFNGKTVTVDLADPQAAEKTAPASSTSIQVPQLVSQRTRESFLGSNRVLDLFGPLESKPPMRASVAPCAPSLTSREAAAAKNQEIDVDSARASISHEVLQTIVERIVRQIAPDIVREVSWEVVPELSEIIIRQCLQHLGVNQRASDAQHQQ